MIPGNTPVLREYRVSAPVDGGLRHCLDRKRVAKRNKILGEHGVTERSSVSSGGPMAGAMKYHVRILGEEGGGDKRGTPELYIGDPDGIVLQIQDTKYCGGTGLLGEVCPAIESSPSKGLLALRDLSHFTVFVSDQQRTMSFYQSLFAMPIQAHQGPTPLLGVGSDRQFLTIVGGFGSGRGGAPPPGINHASFRMEGFHPDQVPKKLAEFGVKPRGDARGPSTFMERSLRAPRINEEVVFSGHSSLAG